MVKLTRRRLVVAALLLAALGALGVWTLLHPASLLVQPCRAERSRPAEHVIFGPYPTEEDFVALKAEGVTRIVSLLNPVVPYEKVLLDEERERARRHGIELVNFPMGSILGQKFGDNYVANSRAAAEAALSAKGTAYIHCYLGVNRAKYVQRYLASRAPDRTRNYAGASGTLALADIDAFGRVEAAYKARDFTRALDELSRMPTRTPQTLRMEAWSNFRTGRIPDAKAAFARLLQELPGDADANVGLGYCALRENDAAAAERHFAAARQPAGAAPAGEATEAIRRDAWTHFRQGRIADARSAFGRIVAALPGDADATSGLGYCALRDNDLAAAESHFGEVLAANGEDIAAVEGMGHVRFRQGRAAEARALFERVVSANPANIETRQMLERLSTRARATVGAGS